MTAAKPDIEKEHTDLLNERYDLSDRPAPGVTMERGKPLQEGVRVKLPAGMTWERFGGDEPGRDSRARSISKGVLSLAASQPFRGGFVFPHFLIDAIKNQDGRDLTRST
jgi:hypothetical protein